MLRPGWTALIVASATDGIHHHSTRSTTTAHQMGSTTTAHHSTTRTTTPTASQSCASCMQSVGACEMRSHMGNGGSRRRENGRRSCVQPRAHPLYPHSHPCLTSPPIHSLFFELETCTQTAKKQACAEAQGAASGTWCCVYTCSGLQCEAWRQQLWSRDLFRSEGLGVGRRKEVLRIIQCQRALETFHRCLQSIG